MLPAASVTVRVGKGDGNTSKLPPIEETPVMLKFKPVRITVSMRTRPCPSAAGPRFGVDPQLALRVPAPSTLKATKRMAPPLPALLQAPPKPPLARIEPLTV